MAVSFGTRKGLGRRYGVDPALLLAQQELENKYALLPGQEARTLQREQNAAQLDLQSQQAKQAGYSGLIGTAGNLATTGMMMNAYKGNELLYPVYGKSAEQLAASKATATQTGTTPATGFGKTTVADPSKVGVITQGAGAAGLSTNAAGSSIQGMETLQGSNAALEASMAGMPTGTSAFGLGATGYAAGAGYLGGMLGQPIGEALGVGGKAERGAAGGALAGAAVGASYGSVAGVPGVVVGAVVGGVVGLATNTWICTATHKHVGMSKEQKSSMKKLRRYAKTHYPGWLEFYNQYGPILIEGIELNEHDLEMFYGIVKRKLVEPCVQLIEQGYLELAFNLYKDKTTELFKEYTPDITIQEVS